MKKIKHPNVIRLYEVIDNPQSDKLYMGMLFLLIYLLYSAGVG